MSALEVVVFEETGEERQVVGRCGRCERTHMHTFARLSWSSASGGVVSPAGVMHVAAEYGLTACGLDATGPKWWWPS